MIPPEELESVAGDRGVWNTVVSFSQNLMLDERKMMAGWMNGWMDGWIGKTNMAVHVNMTSEFSYSRWARKGKIENERCRMNQGVSVI